MLFSPLELQIPYSVKFITFAAVNICMKNSFLCLFWQSINQKRECVLLPLKLPSKEWIFLFVTHTIGRAFSGGSHLRCYVDGNLVSSEKCRWANPFAFIFPSNVNLGRKFCRFCLGVKCVRNKFDSQSASVIWLFGIRTRQVYFAELFLVLYLFMQHSTATPVLNGIIIIHLSL